MGRRDYLVQGQSLGEGVMAIYQQLNQAVSEAAQISDSSCPTMAHPWHMLRDHGAPPALKSDSTTGRGDRGWRQWSAVRSKGDLHPRL